MENYNSIVRKARQSNLLLYLESKGYTFKREGQRYRCIEHTSLIILPPNAFAWNSKNVSGNSIDFLTKCLGLSFKEAIEQLTNIDLEQQKSPSQQRTEKGNYIIDNSLIPRAYGYLIQRRNISHKIISSLVKNSDIEMLDKGPYKHAVIGFKVLNEHREPIGFEVQGTMDKVRFKGVTRDIKYGYGFNIINGKPEKAYFFESAIDLLSFIQLCKTKKLDIDISNSILVSLAGLKESILKHTLRAFKIDLEPVLCVDQDNAGVEFKKLLKEQGIAYKEILPPTPYKDWNNFLQEV